jgi:hypothetical protein
VLDRTVCVSTVAMGARPHFDSLQRQDQGCTNLLYPNVARDSALSSRGRRLAGAFDSNPS